MRLLILLEPEPQYGNAAPETHPETARNAHMPEASGNLRLGREARSRECPAVPYYNQMES